TATDDPDLAVALRELREYGWRERYVSARTGINTRLDPLQAAVLAARLPRLADDNARRQAIADRYDRGLAGLPLALPRRRTECTHVFHQYVIAPARRDECAGHRRAPQTGPAIHVRGRAHRSPALQTRFAGSP